MKKARLLIALMVLSQVSLVAFCTMTGAEANDNNQTNYYNMASQKFYCEYCGVSYMSVSSLTAFKCPRHPNGANKGNHKLYEGSEKNKYTCKYCGIQYSSISSLTSNKCPRHPNGGNKGNHSPAL